MNFELTINQEASSKVDLIKRLETQLQNFIFNKSYGEELKSLSFKINVVNPPAGFEHLHKIMPPKYIYKSKVRNKYTGEEITFEKHCFLSFNITGEVFEDFVSLSDRESSLIFSKMILNSLEDLNLLNKKLGDFNKDAFKSDIQNALNIDE